MPVPLFYGWIVVAIAFVTMGLGVNAPIFTPWMGAVVSAAAIWLAAPGRVRAVAGRTPTPD